MVKLPPFIVFCERIGKRNAYYVRFPINKQLLDIVKSLPDDTRKWNPATLAWEIKTYSLYLIIKKFKGSDKIHFDFGTEESRKVFINQIKKIQIEEAEKRKFIKELNVKKEQWVEYKNELEHTYHQYSDKLHGLLNDGVKLYPHQIVAAMFMNVTRNTLISHQMGLGKTLSSILYVEMNGFDKVVVITPNSLKFNFHYEVQKFTKSLSYVVNWKKNNCSIEDAKYIILNYEYFNPSKYDRFLTKWKKLGITKINSVILDECLTYNTKISTNKGELSIGEIVEKKLDVEVYSYNHNLKKIELKPIKRFLHKGEKKVICVILSDGMIIQCTPDHKFYSFDRDKYIEIKDFKYREKVLKKKKISDVPEFSQDQEIEIFKEGMESVEIYELENKEDIEKVYDLEIVDNHNFFANGVLVHNCQRIKNTKSNTYKNFKKTFNKKIFLGERESKIFLSGTPAPNRAYELYSVLNQISPIDFPTKKYFYEYYCGMTYDVNGWGYVAEEEDAKFEELFHKIAPFTHRKKKEDALKDLPNKLYQRIVLEMDGNEEQTYEDIENSVITNYLIQPTTNPLTIMLRLRQYLSTIKVKQTLELINNILNTGEKVVVVDMFKDSLYELKNMLGDVSVLHTGDQSVEDRSNSVNKFQDPKDKIKVFLASIQTANYGLTLTAASKMIILTPPFSVGEYDQVADRIHRISQKNSVNIYSMIFPNTIDDYVYSSIESKRREITKVLDNEDYKSEINDSVFNDVINIIKNKHGK